MPTLLEKVALARDRRRLSDKEFRDALRAAHENHTWAEIADVAELSRQGVIWLADPKRKLKGEK